MLLIKKIENIPKTINSNYLIDWIIYYQNFIKEIVLSVVGIC